LIAQEAGPGYQARPCSFGGDIVNIRPVGRTLPADVVYYPVPTAVVMQIGVPPSGYRYVRQASDILMISVGSRMVVDGMQDLIR
jgi:hypothetical protein